MIVGAFQMDNSFLTIVSGLPRSGTSMMMQIIDAGGMQAVADGIRANDIDNPKGYYEFEPVKQTKEDPSWVPTSLGKVVKMVYRLLYDLPLEGFEYRIVMMKRNIEEVLTSQEKMLKRSGLDPAAFSREQMTAMFKSELQKVYAWLEEQPNFTMVEVDYGQMVKDPLPLCEKVNEFLGSTLDVDKMATAVDPSLHRNNG